VFKAAALADHYMRRHHHSSHGHRHTVSPRRLRLGDVVAALSEDEGNDDKGRSSGGGADSSACHDESTADTDDGGEASYLSLSLLLSCQHCSVARVQAAVMQALGPWLKARRETSSFSSSSSSL